MKNGKTNYELDISTLFKVVGIEKNSTVQITEHTHDFNPNTPKDSWLYSALLGFKEYQRRYGKVRSFASIGTGAGIDAIGAYEIFHPRKIFLTDIHPLIPQVALKNVKNNLADDVQINSFVGDLCYPLIENGVKVDLVYANVPNIPSDQPRFNARDSASFYQIRKERCPKIFEKYLLTLQYVFLKEARRVINKGGAVIDAIGGRLPYEILRELFIINGYKFEELISVFKIQTEQNYVLKGYAAAEQKYGVEFDFYEYEKTQNIWIKLEKNKFKGPELKEELKKYRVTATTAYDQFQKNNKNFGHLIHILCGKF